MLRAIVLVLALLVPAWTQTIASQSPAAKPSGPSSTTEVPGTGVSVQEQSQPQATPQTAGSEPPKPITKAQAKELFRSVDEILQFVSQDTGLPIKHSVKRKLITRSQVEKYVEKRLKEDKDTKRLERAELVLKKFGLVPADYDLHSAFVKLLKEQVAAYYDSKTKTVNLLDWVQPELQRPVLAHELTHALQDQTVDLEKWAAAGAKDDKPSPDEQEQVIEEAQAARQNVTEGQAMLAMLDYTLAPANLNVLTAPDTVNAMRAAMTETNDSPVLSAAPVFLRESLMMPYTFGLDFERSVLEKKGKSAAFLDMLQHPPADTREVMQPSTYLDGKRVPPLPIPDLDKVLAPDYERYDFGGMGAFDIFLLSRQYAPASDAKEHYPHWRGGYYLAAHDKNAPKNQIALIYVSRWDSPESAKSFARMYGDYVPHRYKGASPLPSSCGVTSEGSESECPVQEWNTAEGHVILDRRGADLLILESFNQATADRLRKALPASSPVQ